MKPPPVWATTCRLTASHASSIAFPTGVAEARALERCAEVAVPGTDRDATGASEAAEAPAGGGTGFDAEHPALTSARPASQETRRTRRSAWPNEVHVARVVRRHLPPRGRRL